MKMRIRSFAAALGLLAVARSVPAHFAILSFCLLSGSVTASAVENESETVDAGGGYAENSSFQSHCSVGQGTCSGSLANSGSVALSGFMNTFVLHPLLDNDEDGLVDEIDLDDDGDGLRDETELAGTAFEPMTISHLFKADTDGDGSGDGAEAYAGTNPLEAEAVLRVIGIETLGGDISLEWNSRGGRVYQVFWTPDLITAPSLFDTVVASGGIAPWFETISQSILPMPATDRAYFIVKPSP